MIDPVCVAKGSRQLGRGESNAGIETWGKEDDLLASRTVHVASRRKLLVGMARPVAPPRVAQVTLGIISARLRVHAGMSRAMHVRVRPYPSAPRPAKV